MVIHYITLDGRGSGYARNSDRDFRVEKNKGGRGGGVKEAYPKYIAI